MHTQRNLAIALLTAALLWMYMFSPWTHGAPNFWIVMSFSAVTLSALAISFLPDRRSLLKVERPGVQLMAGIALAFLLWGVFWVGDKASAFLFDFARPQVDNVYAMKEGLPGWLIALLLLLLIGPAEELFWRGYVQRTLEQVFFTSEENSARSRNIAFALTAVIYALVHIWSFNFMLIMAALVAGLVWGLCYRLNPKMLPALIVSHAVWDALVFIILPI